MSSISGVRLQDIPVDSSVQAYETVDGAFVPSTFHTLSSCATDDEDVVTCLNAYVVMVVANISNPSRSTGNSFNIWAGYTDDSVPPLPYAVVFDYGVFQRHLVRLDCGRDDNCGMLTSAVVSVSNTPALIMRNKDPRQRYDYYFSIMMNCVIAAGVFYFLESVIFIARIALS